MFRLPLLSLHDKYSTACLRPFPAFDSPAHQQCYLRFVDVAFSKFCLPVFYFRLTFRRSTVWAGAKQVRRP